MECFGDYTGSASCDRCRAVYLCMEAAQEADGYWDELERRQAAWLEENESALLHRAECVVQLPGLAAS